MGAKQYMVRNWKFVIAAAIYAVGLPHAWAEPSQLSTLDIEWENGVNYVENVADSSKLATSPNMVNVNLRNFMPWISIADIISVNGKPARGSWVARGQFIMLVPGPIPGQAI